MGALFCKMLSNALLGFDYLSMFLCSVIRLEE